MRDPGTGVLSGRSRWLAAALLWVSAVGCGAPEPVREVASAAEEVPRQGGTLVVGSISDVDSWNEYLSRQSFANALLRRVYLRLAQERGGDDTPDAFAPLLAEGWEFSPDGLALTFTLREATWSDGVPVSSDDVRFTWLAQTSPDVPWIAAESKSAIEDVVVEDPRRVTFRFARRYPFQLADAVEGGILPAHVFGRVPFAEWTTHDWSSTRVASGPFVLDEHRPGDEIRLVRNASWFGAGPLLDRVVVRIVPDAASLVTLLRTGEIDYVEGVTPRDAESLAREPGLDVLGYDRPGYDFVGWNGARAPFDDPAVRRAMTLAIDRDALVEDLLYGHGRVSSGPVLSYWWAADRAVSPLPYDPDEARRILGGRGYLTLTGAGTPAGGGETLRFELLTNAGNGLREASLLKIQEQLRRIGVEVTVRPMEMRAMRERIAAGDFDAYLGGWVYSIKDLRSVFGSDYLVPKGGNVVHYVSPEADRIFAEIDAATDWQAARTPLAALQRRIRDDQPYTFLFEARRIVVHRARVRGVAIDVPADPLAGLERFWVR